MEEIRLKAALDIHEKMIIELISKISDTRYCLEFDVDDYKKVIDYHVNEIIKLRKKSDENYYSQTIES